MQCGEIGQREQLSHHDKEMAALAAGAYLRALAGLAPGDNTDPHPTCCHEWHGADGGACPGWDSHPPLAQPAATPGQQAEQPARGEGPR